MRVVVLIPLWALGGWACGLEEARDFLVGRPCVPVDSSCDPGQVCLPHRQADAGFTDFLCRDRRSFETEAGQALRAFCDEALGFVCPPGLQCRADRIREGEPLRPKVCKLPDDPFGPPSDLGLGADAS